MKKRLNVLEKKNNEKDRAAGCARGEHSYQMRDRTRKIRLLDRIFLEASTGNRRAIVPLSVLVSRALPTLRAGRSSKMRAGRRAMMAPKPRRALRAKAATMMNQPSADAGCLQRVLVPPSISLISPASLLHLCVCTVPFRPDSSVSLVSTRERISSTSRAAFTFPPNSRPSRFI